MGACGTIARYRAGCRCDDCRAALAAYKRAGIAKNAERLKADPSLAKHGRYTTYVNWRCRCDDCTKAWRLFCADQRERRKVLLAAGEIEAPHGLPTTYTNYGCRCSECRAAMTASRQRRRGVA